MLFGLGHSTLETDDFVAACQAAKIDTIIDVRSHPGSAKFPQYNKSNMIDYLPRNCIKYEWWPELGGWTDQHRELAHAFSGYDVDIIAYCNNAFPKARIAKKRNLDGKPGFTNFGFHDYQFFMTLPEFLLGIDKLIEKSAECNIACTCCEAAWFKCHRSMIADYLAWMGHSFYHIEPRFRKTMQPRTVVKCSEHQLRERLSRYDITVLTAWANHKNQRV